MQKHTEVASKTATRIMIKLPASLAKTSNESTTTSKSDSKSSKSSKSDSKSLPSKVVIKTSINAPSTKEGSLVKFDKEDVSNNLNVPKLVQKYSKNLPGLFLSLLSEEPDDEENPISQEDIENFLEAGLNLSSSVEDPEYGRITPLDYACETLNIPLMKSLLEAGASTTLLTKMSPLERVLFGKYRDDNEESQLPKIEEAVSLLTKSGCIPAFTVYDYDLLNSYKQHSEKLKQFIASAKISSTGDDSDQEGPAGSEDDETFPHKGNDDGSEDDAEDDG